jgi:carbon monoxide dehydrogenase subunit G
MAITVTINIEKEFKVPASIDTVFEVLADVPKSASHFPKVDKLVDMGDNVFRWEMEKIGVDKHALQTIYACKYVGDKEAGKITWTAVKGVGNGEVNGHWALKTTSDGGTSITFITEGKLTLPLPSLLKLAISPVVKHEFTALTETYIDNLTKTFSA